MGSSQSTFPGTPLGCMLNNWKAFRRQADYGIVLCKDNLIKFCTLEWAALGVEWPEGGTLKPEIVQAVHSTVTRKGNWDQYPYIDIWQDLVADPPPWLQKCKTRTLKTLMARAPVKKPGPPVKKSCPPTIIPSAPDYMPPPPLYPGLPVIADSPPPASNSLDTGEDTNSDQDFSDQEPSPIASRLRNKPKSGADSGEIQVKRDGSSAPDCNPENKVTVYPGPTMTPKKRVRKMAPNYTPGDTQVTLTRSYTMPLRETLTSNGQLTMLYVPFTSSDLYNWKHQNPPFSEDPAPLTTVFETLISAHNPTWGDMRVALNTLLTAEERRLVFLKAREQLEETEKMQPSWQNYCQKALLIGGMVAMT
ncbi:pollen-specific leucine-rich repeat extensin-like protein 2 [Mauremys reevesii]|uniref:pollen-specific leucine-rich repeat extensin-like protein 2 n=1 Tax=Mauremys reevesii TaxID=260615 RepID=UPI00193FC7E6|nr:pollen-specific leucine-rich repeat extensin-like protein 2 [Mauremys reevesii]